MGLETGEWRRCRSLSFTPPASLRSHGSRPRPTRHTALQVEVGEMPLQIRRKQLMMNYWVHLQSYSEDRHPTVKVLLPCWEKERSVLHGIVTKKLEK